MRFFAIRSLYIDAVVVAVFSVVIAFSLVEVSFAMNHLRLIK